jgi:hypothetical protein
LFPLCLGVEDLVLDHLCRANDPSWFIIYKDELDQITR